ncbi:MAG: hypothetical protein WA624_05815 [Methylocella sp.]
MVDIESGSSRPPIYAKGQSVTTPNWQGALTPDGSGLVTGSPHKTLELWDTKAGALLHSFDGLAEEARAMAVSRDGLHLVVGLEDGTASIWTLDPFKPVKELKRRGRLINSVAFSPDGARVITSGDGSFETWDASTGQSVKELSREDAYFTSAIYNKDATVSSRRIRQEERSPCGTLVRFRRSSGSAFRINPSDS